MSLGIGAPSARNCRAKSRSRRHHRRSNLNSNSPNHYRAPKALPAPANDLATSVARVQPEPEEDYRGKRAEEIFDAHAYRAGLKSLKEPHALYQGFEWRGLWRTRPDRFLVDLEVYVEITGGRKSHKIDRIDGVMKTALANGELVDIVLFDRDDIAALDHNEADLWDLLNDKLEALAAKRAAWAMAA